MVVIWRVTDPSVVPVPSPSHWAPRTSSSRSAAVASNQYHPPSAKAFSGSTTSVSRSAPETSCTDTGTDSPRALELCTFTEPRPVVRTRSTTSRRWVLCRQ